MFVGTEVGLADANTTIPETDRHSRIKGLMLIEILKYDFPTPRPDKNASALSITFQCIRWKRSP